MPIPPSLEEILQLQTLKIHYHLLEETKNLVNNLGLGSL